MKKSFGFILFIFSIGLGLLFISPLLLEHSAVWSRLQTGVQHSTVLLFWRYGLYFLLFMLWPLGVRHYGQTRHWSPEVIQLFQTLRWRYVGLVIFIEVFFVYNVLGHVIAGVY